MGFLKALLGFFTGGGASGIAAEIRGARADQLNAENDEDRIAADERMAKVAMMVEAQTRGSGSWMPKAIRGCFGMIVPVYFGKLLIWDKVLGWGATDPLNGFADWSARMVMAFYFLDATVHKLKAR